MPAEVSVLSTPAPAASPYDRVSGWALTLVAALTPLVVIYALALPNLGQAYFLQFAVLGLVVAQGIAWISGWRAAPRRPGLVGALLLINGVALAASVARSPYPLFSLKEALLPLCGVLYFLMLRAHPSRETLLRRQSLVLAVLGVALAIYGIAQHFGFEFLRYGPQVQKNRVIATIGHPNFLASVLGPTIFILLGAMLSRLRARWYAAGGVMILVMLFCTNLGGTRAVWLGLLVGFGALFVLGTIYCLRHRIGLRVIRGLAVGVVLALVGLTVLVLYFLPAVHRPINIAERLTSEREIKSRLYYWRAAIDLARENPWGGQGYAMFDPKFLDYEIAHLETRQGDFYYDMIPLISWRTPGHVHNEYLEIACEQGFPALLAWLALLSFYGYYGLMAVLREPDRRRAFNGLCLYCALLTMLVDAFFGFPWRLPVSLIVFATVLAWLHEMIEPSTPRLEYDAAVP